MWSSLHSDIINLEVKVAVAITLPFIEVKPSIFWRQSIIVLSSLWPFFTLILVIPLALCVCVCAGALLVCARMHSIRVYLQVLNQIPCSQVLLSISSTHSKTSPTKLPRQNIRSHSFLYLLSWSQLLTLLGDLMVQKALRASGRCWTASLVPCMPMSS